MRTSLTAVFGAGFLIASLSGLMVTVAPNAVAAPDSTTSAAADDGPARSASDDDAANADAAADADAANADADAAAGPAAESGADGDDADADLDEELAEDEQETTDDVQRELADDVEQALTDELEQALTEDVEQELTDTAELVSADAVEQELVEKESAIGADADDDHAEVADDGEVAAVEVGGADPATRQPDRGETVANMVAASPPSVEDEASAEPAEVAGESASPNTAEESRVATPVSAEAGGVGDPAPAARAEVAGESASVPLEATAQAPPRPTLLNLVGSLVLNVLVGLIQLIDGPPVLPANSTATVRTSSLNLPIGSGRSVQADWYFPADVDDETRFVYLQHGFLATGPMYSFTAANLAERTNSIVVAPSLSSNFFAPDAAWVGGSTMHRAVADLFVGDRAALTNSASAAAGYDVVLPDEFVLVGHSAGGTLVTAAAGYLTENGAIGDLAGIVMLDGVEPAGSHLVSAALAKLTDDDDRPIYLISSERYFWSRGGDMADKVQLARPDRFNGLGLDGGLHVDYMVGGNPLIQFGQYVVAGFSRTENVDAAGVITAGWVNDLFAGVAVDGIYGAPGQELGVDTLSGTATAVVLPLGRPERPVWPPLLDAALTAVFDFAGRYLFVYEPLRGFEL